MDGTTIYNLHGRLVRDTLAKISATKTLFSSLSCSATKSC